MTNIEKALKLLQDAEAHEQVAADLRNKAMRLLPIPTPPKKKAKYDFSMEIARQNLRRGVVKIKSSD